MLQFPNAKINIGLNVIEKRSDGFHNIESCFYPVGWSDALELISKPKQTATEGLFFTSSGLVISGEASTNLCIKALKLLQKTATEKFETEQLHLHLHKIIPMGAGLGGGSADGAFTLKMLNEHLSLGFNTEELQVFARQLGSDCAFFIENKPIFCTEKGDKFEPIALSLKGYYIVLLNPAIHIATAEAYAHLTPKIPEVSLKKALASPIRNWKDTIVNDFEAHLANKYPLIAQLKNELYAAGAVYASMTGSGSTVYGIFEVAPTFKNKMEGITSWEGRLN